MVLTLCFVMSLLLFACSQEITCANALCAPIDCELDSDCLMYDLDEELACCPSCCDSGCAQCLVDPCSGYVCQSDPDLTCESNYCGGCNRLWYSDEFFGYRRCDNEARVSDDDGDSVSNNDDDDDVFTTIDDEGDDTLSAPDDDNSFSEDTRTVANDDDGDSTSTQADDDDDSFSSSTASMLTVTFSLLAFMLI